jgi:hypothetical protein
MKRKLVIMIGLAGGIAAAGCGKGKNGGAAGSVELDLDEPGVSALETRVNDAKFADAAAQIEKHFGPARRKDDRHWVFVATRGDACDELLLMKQSDGDRVSSAIAQIYKVGDSGYRTCQKLAELPPAD